MCVWCAFEWLARLLICSRCPTAPACTGGNKGEGKCVYTWNLPSGTPWRGGGVRITYITLKKYYYSIKRIYNANRDNKKVNLSIFIYEVFDNSVNINDSKTFPHFWKLLFKFAWSAKSNARLALVLWMTTNSEAILKGVGLEGRISLHWKKTLWTKYRAMLFTKCKIMLNNVKALPTGLMLPTIYVTSFSNFSYCINRE